MLMLYFSGTGNSKYISELFSKKMECSCHSIEENLNFKEMIGNHKIIGFCYPIYGSRVPRIMRDFVSFHLEEFANKKVFIFCTQYMFSGDGARAFTDLFPKNHIKVIYAEHFFMPTNISDFTLFPIRNGKQNRRFLIHGEKKMNRVCNDMKRGIVRKRGFHPFSRLLGLCQGLPSLSFEKKMAYAWKADHSCNGCKVCESLCPVRNLTWNGQKMISQNNCILCYRCVNKCPKRAITIFSRKKVKNQYKGISL